LCLKSTSPAVIKAVLEPLSLLFRIKQCRDMITNPEEIKLLLSTFKESRENDGILHHMMLCMINLSLNPTI